MSPSFTNTFFYHSNRSEQLKIEYQDVKHDPELSPFEKQKQLELIDKAAHYSHIRTQGTTADPFLPLWAGSDHGRAMTLFYRMAYVGTHTIGRGVIKPL